MKRWIVFCGLLLTVWSHGAIAAAVESLVSIPVLVVQDNSGIVETFELRLERTTDEDRPLFISIAEDTPMGSGDALRASAWQAAMTVGMLRKDALQGARLTYEIHGRIDGPSAGCGMALGLMAALDGRRFPKDVAVTGTVLPDGSIGRVGGIHLKMMAAKQAGKKRIVLPACLRFEYDATKNVRVDLKVLADTLGLDYVPVGTLEEAYRTVFDIPKMETAGITMDEAEMPEYMDDYFKDLYGQQMAQYAEWIEIASKIDWPEDQANPLYQLATEAWEAGQQAAEAGYIDVATDKLREGLAGVQTFINILKTIANHDDVATISVLRQFTDEQLKERRNPLTIIDRLQERGLSSATTTFMGDVATGEALQKFVQELGNETATTSEEKSEDDVDAKEQALYFELYRARLSTWVTLYYSEYNERILRLNGYFSDSELTPSPSFLHTEALLFSSLLTTKSTFDRLLSGGDAAFSQDDIYAKLLVSDPHLISAFGDVPAMLHRAVQRATGEKQKVLCAVAVHVYVKYIAEMNRWILLIGELDPKWLANERMTIQRHGLLHRLLAVSRERAIRAMKSCRDKSLPWLSAFLEFRNADYARDDTVTDKTEVLAGYWKAAMQADAVLMMYSGGKDGNNVRRSVRTTFVEVVEILPDSQTSVRMMRPGDKIIKVDGLEVRSEDELTALVAAMPKGYSYPVEFVPKGSMKVRRVRAIGGQLLGIRVKNYRMF